MVVVGCSSYMADSLDLENQTALKFSGIRERYITQIWQ